MSGLNVADLLHAGGLLAVADQQTYGVAVIGCLVPVKLLSGVDPLGIVALLL